MRTYHLMVTMTLLATIPVSPVADVARSVVVSEQDPEEWWPASRAARLLGIHRVTLHRIPRSRLPYREIGERKIRRYRPDDVRAYTAGQDAPPGESLPSLMAEQDRILAEHEARLRRIEDRLGEP
jgi:hypothetical protein